MVKKKGREKLKVLKMVKNGVVVSILMGVLMVCNCPAEASLDSLIMPKHPEVNVRFVCGGYSYDGTMSAYNWHCYNVNGKTFISAEALSLRSTNPEKSLVYLMYEDTYATRHGLNELHVCDNNRVFSLKLAMDGTIEDQKTDDVIVMRKGNNKFIPITDYVKYMAEGGTPYKYSWDNKVKCIVIEIPAGTDASQNLVPGTLPVIVKPVIEEALDPTNSGVYSSDGHMITAFDQVSFYRKGMLMTGYVIRITKSKVYVMADRSMYAVSAGEIFY